MPKIIISFVRINYTLGKDGKRMSPLQELHKIAGQLPLPVLADVDKRIGDWLASGGKENDPYIEQQLRFAKRFVREDKYTTQR